MEIEEIKEIIKQQLPLIMQTDKDVERFIILQLSSQYYADKMETETRFDRILREIEKHREEDNRRWEEHRQEDKRKWEEQNRKWDENQKEIRRLPEAMKRRYDQTIGALGAQWGLRSEASFRNALAGILEESFKVEVLHITEFDDKGEVFGRPDQVELDVLINQWCYFF